MSAIFISHSSRDAAAAGELKAWLGAQGHRSVFLDFDPEDGIPAGRDWERELYARLRSCQAVVVLCSEYSMASRWCFAEIAFARSLGKALLPLKIDDCAIPAAFTDVQLVDLRADPEAGYRRLWAGLRQAGLDPAEMFDWDGSRPPYPGLMVFQEQDAAIYFGRGGEVQATIEKLNRMQRLGDGQFAMILGASGSGKSSLLRAGVLPRLKRDCDRWLAPGVFRPLGQPFERLATMLSAAFKSAGVERPWQEIRDRLAQPSAKDAAVNLRELANDLRAASGQGEATLLLGVDQFEELLARGESDIADRFLALLRTLADQHNSGVVVIGTLRSDFLGSLQNRDAIRGTRYEPIDLPKFPIEAFSEVIEGPARIAGLELEPGLAGAIVADAATDDALPLLAFAMRELWEARGADGRLTIDRYRNGLGGLQGSVARAADGICPKAFASPEEEREVRNAFLSMVRVDAGGAYVRRPTRWGNLSQRSHVLLERFVQGRLLVARGEGADRLLEVAHEALIRRWDKLRRWVEEDHEFLRVRERVESAAARWLEGDRDGSLLLPRGRPLAEAQEIQANRGSDLAPALIEFIDASTAAKREQDDVEQKRERERQRAATEARAAKERETASRRLAGRTRLAALGIGILALMAAGFAWYAVQQANEAKQQQIVADAARGAAEKATEVAVAQTQRAETLAQDNATLARFLKLEYEQLFAEVKIPPDKQATVDKLVATIQKNKYRYEAVAAETGVPWHVMAFVHIAEAGGDFTRHLHNGDPLTGRTIHVPAGRPVSGTPPFTWEESAVDFIHFYKLDEWKDWSIPAVLVKWEQINGLGYRRHGVRSPYVWACTSLYTKGEYTTDGKFDADAVYKSCGGAAILRRLIELGDIIAE